MEFSLQIEQFVFVLFRPSLDTMTPTSISEGESSLLALLVQRLISFENALTEAHTNNVLPATIHPLLRSS